MERLNSLSKQVTGRRKAAKPVMSSIDWFGVSDVFGGNTKQLRARIRPLLEAGIEKVILPHIENATFPTEVAQVFKTLQLGHYFLKGKYGNGCSDFDRATVITEVARIDASAATLLLVQTKLIMRTIELYGNEEQKSEYLPKLRDFELVGGWGLTEDLNGSDASAMKSTVKQVGDQYILNGNKRWIGNANKDIITVFAKNVDTGIVECFILDLTSPGVSREAIKHKMALRPVQNMQIYFQNVKIPAKLKLPGVKGFGSVATLLAESRLGVGWVAAGIGIGVYDYMMKYLTQRKQFKKVLTSYQLIQDKIVRVMGAVQASLLMCCQAQRRLTEGSATIGQLALVKAYCTKTIREASGIGRESLGGNGIITDNHLMKCVIDMEAIYTYEGTYDINTLVAGRELTGVAAFKTR